MTLTHILVDFDNVKPTAADIALARGDKVRLAVVRGPQQTRYEADLAEALHAMGDHVTFTRCAKAGKNAADMQIAFHLGELVAGLGTASSKAARFVVISRDKDFDPLVLFLQARGFDATRAANFKAALGGKAAEPEARPRTRAAKASAPAAKASAPAAPRKTVARKTAVKRAPAARKAAVTVAPPIKKPAHAAGRTAAKTPAARDAIGRILEGLERKGDERPGKRKGLERFIESHLGRNLAPGQLDALVAQLERDGVLAFRDNKVEYRLPKAKK
jgi:hypothetical protein